MKEYYYLISHANGLSQELITTMIVEGDDRIIDELWVRTTDGTTESKIKINIPSLASQIQLGNSKLLKGQELNNVFESFQHILDDETIKEYHEQQTLETLHSYLDEFDLNYQTELLLKGHEHAIKEHPSNLTIDEIIKRKTSN